LFQVYAAYGSVVRQIGGVWVFLPVTDLATGFQINPQSILQILHQSVDCAGQGYYYAGLSLDDPPLITEPVQGLVATIPPATQPSIYFAGSPTKVLTINSFSSFGAGCQPYRNPNPVYVGPIQSVPVSSLGLTLPFSIK
jgi:hypothetical protein